MKRLLVVLICILCCAGTVWGQAGGIGLFADTNASWCELIDLPGLVFIYVFHVNSPGVTGSQFRVVPYGGANMIWLSDTVSFPTFTGNSQAGIAIDYGACYPTPLLVDMLTFFAQGISPLCSGYQAVADPASGASTVLVTDCMGNTYPGTGGSIIVNSTPDCRCNVPVEETTWGKLKAQYQH